MTLDIQNIKQRFEIIGTDPNLDRAIEKAMRVSPTDISVLITGESGVGKEIFPKIIHQLSHRKHNKFIAVNCGAIPEGTIDSELFGHEKGAFTGATSTRSGYFEVADGGTIFLDEVGELPMTTQVRLLRVLENGEFIKVGSSKVQKTNVRIVAATNVNMDSAIQKNKFREDLYYRLSTIEINIPPLRKRKNDIVLLFRKFASDFAKKYNMPTVRLDDEAQILLKNYRWNGNIRQLKNVTEQLSVLEQERAINASLLGSYLPNPVSNLPALIEENNDGSDFSSEREILYKILFDMRNDIYGDAFLNASKYGAGYEFNALSEYRIWIIGTDLNGETKRCFFEVEIDTYYDDLLETSYKGLKSLNEKPVIIGNLIGENENFDHTKELTVFAEPAKTKFNIDNLKIAGENTGELNEIKNLGFNNFNKVCVKPHTEFAICLIFISFCNMMAPSQDDGRVSGGQGRP